MGMATDFLETAKIVAFSTSAAIVYGVLHDQVTAHLCVEYFSVAHPPVFATSSPFLLGLGWGVIATWWVGLPLGLGLAAAARIGRAPKLSLAQLRTPIVKLMIACALAAFVTGAVGAALVAAGHIELIGMWATVIAPGRHVVFAADAWAHLASYLCGVLGGLLLIGLTISRRLRARRQPGLSPSTCS